MKKKHLWIYGLLAVVLLAAAGYGGYRLKNKLFKSSNLNKVEIAQNIEAIPTRNLLSVNYSTVKHAFSDKMLGVNFVNWQHSWGKPYPGDIKGLAQILKAAHVGIIRYAGGNWSNTVAWDRGEVRDPYTGWPNSEDGPYWFQYNKEEIDSVARLAQEIGAEVLIEVNISVNDPQMWADMVKYTNVEHNYGFKYWELGNEQDGANSTPDPDEFAKRLGVYIDAMMDVDPNIKITASAVASPYEATRLGYDDNITGLSQYLTKPYAVVSAKGRKIQALTYHWYQTCNADDPAALQRYAWDELDDGSWRNLYSRKEADLIAPQIIKELTQGTIPLGVTEFNVDSCNYENPMNSNFLNALWTTDVIGRMAYHGTDFATRWEGYGTQGYSMIYPDDAGNPTQLAVRPAYYAFLMYANYFGDQMVESSSNDNARLSIWASRDSADATKLKLMVTNLSETDLPATLNLPGFSPTSAQLYEMRSVNPTDITNDSFNITTTINGLSINPMDVANSLAQIVPKNLEVSGSSLVYTFPAYSTTALVLTGGFGPTPTPDPNASPTPTIGFLPTPSPTPVPTFALSATTSTDVVAAGQTITITTNLRADSPSGNLILNTEVWCSSDKVNWNKDFQQDWETGKLNPDQNQPATNNLSFTAAFEVPADHSKAECAIKSGLFLPGWSKQLVFSDVGGFSIK